MGVSSSGFDFEDTIFNGQERDIESSSSQIEDENVLLSFSFLIESISNGSSSGLIDDSQYVESRNATSIFGGLSLGVIKVGRDSDNSILDASPRKPQQFPSS